MKNQRLLILTMVIFYIFSPTLFAWVINPEGSWYRPFVLWSLLVAGAYVFQQRKAKQ